MGSTLVELVSSTKINFLIESLLKTAKLALLSLWCKKKKPETTNLPKIQKTNKQTTTKKPNGNTKVKINNSYTKRTNLSQPYIFPLFLLYFCPFWAKIEESVTALSLVPQTPTLPHLLRDNSFMLFLLFSHKGTYCSLQHLFHLSSWGIEALTPY